MTKTKTIYIHIGTPKTGTTAIQRFLTQNSTILAQKGILYPIVGRFYVENQKQIYNSENALTAINGRVIFDRELFKEQLDIFAKSDCSTMILSEENLFLYLHQENQLLYNDRLWELLSNYEVKIIVYFRQSAEYLTSQWQEYIKLKLQQNFEEYLETTDYAESLAAVYNLLTLVKLEDIIVRTFEPTRWLNNDLIDDFLSTMDIEKSDEFMPLKVRENETFSRDYCERILYVNQHLKAKSDTEDIYGINEMIRVGDNPQTILESLPDEMIKKISDKYYPLECEIAKKFLSRDELFLTKYPKIYQTKRPAYQLNITSQEITELRQVISYGLQWQILAKQKLQEELLQKILTQQELQEELLQKTLTQQEFRHEELLAKQEELLQKILTQQELRHEEKIKSRFFYILLKPLLIIYNIICYKSTRKYIIKRLLRQ